ncbi:MAG: hypothetical protein Q4B32_11280 [Clostridia bacterium]|nr:hypothetical protein [Clostridia bacterium]
MPGGKYDDILHLPHHVSEKHPPIPMEERAAQFSPYAALTGFGAVIDETRRLTDPRHTLSEEALFHLNRQYQLLLEHLPERPEITMTYFRPDTRKDGGAYLTLTGRVKKVEAYEQRLVLEDGTIIAMENIMSMEGKVFAEME